MKSCLSARLTQPVVHTLLSVVLLQVTGLEEMEIRDLDQVTPVYAALLCCHIRLLKLLLPGANWKSVPVVIVFEQNTYVNSLGDVKTLIGQSLSHSGFRILFYHKWSASHNKYMLGKYVTAKTKVEMVVSTVSAIAQNTLAYSESVMSLSWAVLERANKTTQCLETAIGTAKGTSSSNRMGSALEVSMYKRSKRGANLATDVLASVMVGRDVLKLSDDLLLDGTNVEQGKLLLGKLRDEMAQVTMTESSKGSLVSTGGKRSVRGEYTRDDVLSAFLLLCHARHEIHTNDQNVKCNC